MSVANQIVELTAKVSELMTAIEAKDIAHAESLLEVQNKFAVAVMDRGALADEKALIESELATIKESLTVVTAQLETAKKSLAMEPFTHITEGTAPVADASCGDVSVSTDGKSLLRKLRGMDGVDRLVFYRQNKAVIDSAIVAERK